MFISGFIALFGPIWVFFAIELFGNIELISSSWGLAAITWLTLFVQRKRKGNFFKINYFSDDEVIYSGKDKKYMSEVARINDLLCEKKPFILRLT